MTCIMAKRGSPCTDASPCPFRGSKTVFCLGKETCAHDYHRTGHIGMCIIYECRKCGDEYEKDVS